MSANILIGVAAFRGEIKTKCSQSLTRLIFELGKAGIVSELSFLERTDIVPVRNHFASRVVHDPSKTHLLCVDDDMDFLPQTVLKLIASGYRVAGAACPRRKIDIQRLVEWAKSCDARTAEARATPVAARLQPGQTELHPVNGFIEVEGTGMGLTLIAREALVQLTDHIRVQKIDAETLAPLEKPVYGFFDHIYSDPPMSEDHSFCHRWRKLGGKIHVYIDDTVGHIGDFNYKLKFRDVLQP